MNRREFLAGAMSTVAFSIAARAAKGGRELFDRSACVIPERFANHPLFTTPHCGVNFGFLARRGYFSRPEVRRRPPEPAPPADEAPEAAAEETPKPSPKGAPDAAGAKPAGGAAETE